MNLKPKLWTRDFTLLISATVLGAAGGRNVWRTAVRSRV